jgi:PAS domain S-box-containing protein
LLAVAVVELLARSQLHLPIAAVVLFLNLLVLYFAFSGSLRSGLTSGIITLVYLSYPASINGQLFRATDRSPLRVMLIALASPILALVVGVWKSHAARVFQIVKANAILRAEITERKRGDEALRRAEENRRTLLECAPLGAYRATLHGKFLIANRALAEMLGYASPAELLAASLALDVYRDISEHMRLVGQLRSQERLTGIEAEWKRKDGTPITVRLSGLLVRDATGAPDCLEMLCENLTERRALEEQLRQPQQGEAVGQLANRVGQDFSNLVTVIAGHSQLLLDCLTPDDPLRKSAQEIKNAVDRAAALTQQLSSFSGKGAVAPELLDLSAMVAGMERILRRLLGEDIELVTMLGTALGQVKAEARQIERVLLNLAANARDAMRSGGKLTIKTANVEIDEEYARWHSHVAPGGYVMLAVSDTGCGMDAETQARSFEPFFSTKDRENAMGLGLAIVCGVVKQCGGYIWVYSEPGQGATFKIYLPRVEEAVELTGPEKALRELA